MDFNKRASHFIWPLRPKKSLPLLAIILGLLIGCSSLPFFSEPSASLASQPPDSGAPQPAAQDPAPQTEIIYLPTVITAPQPATGPLRVLASNPRYFTDGSGRAIYLTGSHYWPNFVDDGPTDPPPAFDYEAYLDFLVENQHNFIRLWRAENAKGGELGNNYWFSPMPYQRPGPGKAVDGKPKFDLNKFNQAYFDRLRSRVVAARDRGIYVSIMLFDGWSIESKRPDHHPWIGHPYNKSNNINNINGDLNNNGNGEETHWRRIAAVTALQKAYIRKVIDTVNDLDNVLYEISNESPAGSELWQYDMIKYIKGYEAGKPKQHPVGMTVEYPGGDNAALYASPADWIAPNGDINNPPESDGQKVMLFDSDHFCFPCGDRQWAWKGLTRGGNPIHMDHYDGLSTGRGAEAAYGHDNPDIVSLRLNLGYARSYAKRMNLAAMTPRGDLCSTDYCLANPVATNAEYLVYLPNGGSATVDLSGASGSLTVEWFNPETGGRMAGGTTNGGASRSFTAPFSGDAVLYLYQTPN